MNWYATKSSGRGQGIVIDEDDGRNVAVAYDEKDASLLAAAPRLLKVLNDIVNLNELGVLRESKRAPMNGDDMSQHLNNVRVFDNARALIADLKRD